eukprot:scaffold3261_cov67-Phaeocystis_antarctica.AAC.9
MPYIKSCVGKNAQSACGREGHTAHHTAGGFTADTHTHSSLGTHVPRRTRRARARRAGDAPRGREFGVVRCLGRVCVRAWRRAVCADRRVADTPRESAPPVEG